MLIILEGPDCAGKSTLASDIARRLGDHVTIIRKGPPVAHPIKEYVEPLLHYEPTMKEHIICDRWHLGEVVYPKILQRPTEMDEATFMCIGLFLQHKGASITVLRPPFADLMVRYAIRGDKYISSDRMLAVWQGFQDLPEYSPPFRTADQVIWAAEGDTVRAMQNR